MKKIIVLLIALFSLTVSLNAAVIDKTSPENISSSLKSFYNKLDKPYIYFSKSDKFNCNEYGCTSGKYGNIGLISTYEYNLIGGSNSYLVNINPFYANDNNDEKIITSMGIDNVSSQSSAYIRSTLNVKKGVRVTGSGKKSDPWMFIEPRFNVQIVLEKATINGNRELKEIVNDFEKEYTIVKDKSNYDLVELKCNGKVNYKYDEDTGKLSLTDMNSDVICNVTYKLHEYTIALDITNGTTSNNTLKVIDGTDGEFNINPSENGAFKSAVCTNNQEIVYDKNKFILESVTTDSECTIVYDIVKTEFAYKESDQTYTIPYDGYYTIDAYGAEGAGSGGKGGQARGDIYLTSGTKLTINTGGTNGYNGGGSGLYNGGGASTVKISNAYIVIAAGGGGGKNGTDGGTGNSEAGLASGGSGTNGGAGTAGLNGGGGGSGYDYNYQIYDDCYTGSNTCKGGYIQTNCRQVSECVGGNKACTGGGTGSITYNCVKNSSGTGGYWAGTGTNNVVCAKGCTKSHNCGSAPSGSCTVGASITNSCTGTCSGTYYDSCASTRVVTKCDTVYSDCATGSNTCKGKWLDKTTPYNSGNGGTNYIETTMKNQYKGNGIKTGNGKVIISYKEP